MKFNKNILASLSIVLIFFYGIGVGRYQWFPFKPLYFVVTDINYTFYIIKGAIKKLTYNARQTSTNAGQTSTGSKEAMTFIAYGDNPYVHENDVERVISGLIEAINEQNPSLVVHVGDMFGGQPCTNSMIHLQREMMNKLNAPVLYTPGDNEWRDCVDAAKGPTHNLERLSYIRKTFFSNQQTLGKNSEFVENQSARGYPENMRLMKHNVAFITAHVVGSNNNFDPMSKSNTMEYFERDTANIDWVIESFKKYENASAYVVAIHADMSVPPKPFFRNFSNALNQLSNKYEKPVLILFGDSHRFRTFQPSPKKYPFISAIEVYAWPNLKAIEIEVDVSQKKPFRVVETIGSRAN